MSSDWETCTLSDIVNFGNGKARPKTEGTIPIYGGNGILGFSGNSNYQDETIIIGRVGAYCGATYYEKNPIWVSDNALSAKAKQGYLTKYVYYVLKNKNLNQYAQGSSHPLLTQGLLNTIDVNVSTNIDTQKDIVSVIGGLEGKIELNRQTNQTLEEMAQAVFKSWFVDFEPTRAKIKSIKNGQDPTRAAMAAIAGKTVEQLDTLSPEQIETLTTTADLFPDTLVASDLGEIPEGWEVKALDQIAHYQNGLALQKFRPDNENDFLPVLKIAQLKKGAVDGAERASPNIKPECIVNNGDVVFSWSGSLVVDVWCGGTAALNQHLFKVTSEHYPKWFYYYWTKHHLESFQQIAADKAVTMGHIKRSHLAEAKCAVPCEILSNLDMIRELLGKQIEQRLESRTLVEIRDTLLPKLLSGDLEVANGD